MNDWLAAEQHRITRQLQEGLKAVGCVALIGEYRMGKTSALRSLQAALPAPCVCLSLAALADDGAGPLDERFYLRVLNSLAEQWPGQPPMAIPKALPNSANDRWKSYDWFVESLKRFSTRPITLLIDDAELLADSPWGEQIFRGLPDLLGRGANLRVALAGTSKLELWAMKLARSYGRAGIWDLIRAPIVLGPISLQVIQDAFPDHLSVAQQLIRWCGGHPYCLRQLTGALSGAGILTSTMLQALNDKRTQSSAEWDRTFRHYWQDYNSLVRRVCFILTVTPGGARTQDLLDRWLGQTTDDIDYALDVLNDTGTIYLDTTSNVWRLIELFKQWYANEIGFVAGAWSVDQTIPARAKDEAAADVTADQAKPRVEPQADGEVGRPTGGTIQRLRQQLDELESRHATLTKRIKDLDVDIDRTTGKYDREIRQELRDELNQQRKKVEEEMSSIERRLEAPLESS